MISKRVLVSLLHHTTVPTYCRMRQAISSLSLKTRGITLAARWSGPSLTQTSEYPVGLRGDNCWQCGNARGFHSNTAMMSAEKGNRDVCETEIRTNPGDVGQVNHGQSDKYPHIPGDPVVTLHCNGDIDTDISGSKNSSKPAASVLESSQSTISITGEDTNHDLAVYTSNRSMSIIQRLLQEKEHDDSDEGEEVEDDRPAQGRIGQAGAVAVGEQSCVDRQREKGPETPGAVVKAGGKQTGVLQKVVFPQIYHLAPLVNDSVVLRNLVQVGVDLSKVEEKGMANTILRMDFEEDVKPYLTFLRDIGVPAELWGRVLTKNPYLFQHSVHNLKVRIDYLRSKKFKRSDIVQMIDREPTFLCMSTGRIDSKLGFYQREFRLTGAELRKAVSGLSKLITCNREVFKDNKYHMREFLGFTDVELKKIFLTYPKVFIDSKTMIAENFDYLHNVVGITHAQIVQFPRILRSQRQHIENRHRFLLSCGRAQYDPRRENYVSLQRLVSMKDNEWCVEVAQSSVAEFNDFQRMI